MYTRIHVRMFTLHYPHAGLPCSTFYTEKQAEHYAMYVERLGNWPQNLCQLTFESTTNTHWTTYNAPFARPISELCICCQIII